ncbi:MAG: hypothetical protein WBD55_01650 [Dehalococcoidia bacterium]
MHRFLVLGAVVGAMLAASAAFAGGAFADTSGDNPSGYVWTDTNAPDPTTTYNWMDATGGTLIASTDDDDSADVIPLPFTFYYFGAPNTEIAIGTNGLLSFNIADPNECNDNYNWGPDDFGLPIPHDDADCEGDEDGWGANPLIAPWFDDLDPGECGDVYYQTFGSAPNRTFVVEYSDVCHNDCFDCEPGEGITFEVILFEGSNDIKFQYMDAFFGVDGIIKKSALPKDGRSAAGGGTLQDNNNGNSATVGLDKDATVGLQYSHAQRVIDDELAVLFTTEPVPTPTSTVPPPTAGITPPGPSATVIAVSSLPLTGSSGGGSAAHVWVIFALSAAALASIAGYAGLRLRQR